MFEFSGLGMNMQEYARGESFLYFLSCFIRKGSAHSKLLLQCLGVHWVLWLSQISSELSVHRW